VTSWQASTSTTSTQGTASSSQIAIEQDDDKCFSVQLDGVICVHGLRRLPVTIYSFSSLSRCCKRLFTIYSAQHYISRTHEERSGTHCSSLGASLAGHCLVRFPPVLFPFFLRLLPLLVRSDAYLTTFERDVLAFNMAKPFPVGEFILINLSFKLLCIYSSDCSFPESR
jgi:hypothetical protein